MHLCCKFHYRHVYNAALQKLQVRSSNDHDIGRNEIMILNLWLNIVKHHAGHTEGSTTDVKNTHDVRNSIRALLRANHKTGLCETIYNQGRRFGEVTLMVGEFLTAGRYILCTKNIQDKAL